MLGGDELTETYLSFDRVTPDLSVIDEIEEDDLDDLDPLDSRDLPLWFETPYSDLPDPRG